MDQYPDAHCLYLAIRNEDMVYGVIGIALEGMMMDVYEQNLILSILGECALALEKEGYNRKREEALAQAKNEQLRANLLRSISHDLRTPLTSICLLYTLDVYKRQMLCLVHGLVVYCFRQELQMH